MDSLKDFLLRTFVFSSFIWISPSRSWAFFIVGDVEALRFRSRYFVVAFYEARYSDYDLSSADSQLS